MAPFGRVDAVVTAALADLLGPENVLHDAAALDRHGRDETEDLVMLPELVVRPGNTADVAGVLRIAGEHRIPVTPRGAGTGLSGGCLPAFGGIVLSLERMAALVEIDRDNLVAVAQPGVVTQVLQEAVEALGLFYPPDPASRGSCQLGGNLAHGAGGPRAVKYGTTRDYVLGVEAVLPSGRRVRSGGKLRKYASGYPLHQLLVGSEGTLAVITEATLRLIPLPKARATLLCPFPALRPALATLAWILQRGVVPAAAEFLERDAIEAAARHLSMEPPAARHQAAEALLLFEVDGPDGGHVARDAEIVGEICLQGGAADVLVADDPPRQRELWRLRRAVGEAVKSLSAYREIDAVVPLSRIADLVEGVKAISARHELRAICYGHAGDGNIHVNVLKGALPAEAWRQRIEAAAAELYGFIASLGGALSGEHGVGLVGRPHLASMLGVDTVDLMRQVKAAFDPLGILNPGKVI